MSDNFIGMHHPREYKIECIVHLEKQHNNSWKWIYKASDKEIDELYDYWFQEEELPEGWQERYKREKEKVDE